MRKVCFRLNPAVRFSVDFVGESGDGVYRSHFSEDFNRNIVIGIGHVCKTGFGIRCGFLRQLRTLRVRAVFDQVFDRVASYKALRMASP